MRVLPISHFEFYKIIGVSKLLQRRDLNIHLEDKTCERYSMLCSPKPPILNGKQQNFQAQHENPKEPSLSELP